MLDEPLQHQLNQLSGLLREGELTQHAVSQATGVHQSQISRMLAGKALKPTKNVLAVCRYVRGLSGPNDPKAENLLHAAVLEAWDGTERHAQLLCNALRALAQLQQCYRSEPN